MYYWEDISLCIDIFTSAQLLVNNKCGLSSCYNFVVNQKPRDDVNRWIYHGVFFWQLEPDQTDVQLIWLIQKHHYMWLSLINTNLTKNVLNDISNVYFGKEYYLQDFWTLFNDIAAQRWHHPICWTMTILRSLFTSSK